MHVAKKERAAEIPRPKISESTVRRLSLYLRLLQEAAAGVIHGSPWGPEFDNAANKRFMADFERRHNCIPSEYAAVAYDSAQLIDSALGKVKGNVADKKAFQAALKAADFPSVRGKFRFNHNQLPIQDFFVFEIGRDASGRYIHKTMAKVLSDHQDAYHSECPMK